MNKITLLLILTFFNISFSQSVTIDGINISIEKAKIPSEFSNSIIRSVSFDNTELKSIMVKCKIKSTDQNLTEISAFSLLDTVNKIRYRVGDYLGYAFIIGSPEINTYRKTPTNKKSTFNDFPKYDKTVVDQFENYNFEGYNNFEIPVEFGTKKKPDQSIIYFGKTRFKNFKAELFFITLNNLENSVFALFYKDKKVGFFQLE